MKETLSGLQLGLEGGKTQKDQVKIAQNTRAQVAQENQALEHNSTGELLKNSQGRIEKKWKGKGDDVRWQYPGIKRHFNTDTFNTDTARRTTPNWKKSHMKRC